MAMDYVFENGNLTYVGQDSECIPNWLGKKFGSSTKRLDLSFNKLKSLKGLKGFDRLEDLVLDNNQLADDLEIPQLKFLQTLTLNKNLLVNLDALLKKISGNLPKLTYLSLLGNIACPNQLSNLEKDEEDYQRYRYYVIFRIPNLKFLDSTPVTAKERCEALRVGEYMRVVTVAKEPSLKEDESNQANTYSPLPAASAKEGDHRGTYGKCRYVYYGRHSEGNRFIMNNDL